MQIIIQILAFLPPFITQPPIDIHISDPEEINEIKEKEEEYKHKDDPVYKLKKELED